MELTILHLYPDCMSLYGEYANIAVLRRHLEAMGVAVRVENALFEDAPDFGNADFIYMGAGAERTQKAALAALLPHKEALKAAIDRGAVVLFTGNAMETLGLSIVDAEGKVWLCLGLADFATVETNQRAPEDVIAHTSLWESPVVGFMNKCGVVTGVETPLLTGLDLGFGNGKERGPEGFHWKNVFASQLTGPLLVKNPKLLETVAAAIYARRGKPLPVDRPLDRWAEQAYAVTEEQLRLRAHSK